MSSFFNLFCAKQKPVILFYGANGWIGSQFINFIKKEYPYVKVINGKCRLDKKTDLIIEINIHNPTHIVSFTGRTHGKIDNQLVNTIDYLEYPGKLVENINDNLFGPIQLASICEKKKIHYTYLGTGCIFNSKGLDTEKPENFNEESLPNYFGSGYSVVKGFTDRLMHNYQVLNLRIRMPISSTPNERNFINKITKYSKICSIPNSMTVLDDFFPIFMDLILNKKTGTMNCTNPGIISHNEILEMYRNIIDSTFKWENFTIQEQSVILKSDRSNNALNTKKLEEKYPIEHIKISVQNILKKMKEQMKEQMKENVLEEIKIN
jgi:dTDP-4-dehydrorhamnose reductase